jgi:RND family efflux transporter MFP subunit
MNKINLQKIKDFLFQKKVIVVVVAVFLVAAFLIFRGEKSNVVSIESVKYADLTRSIRATGQVISDTDLKLSFNKAGTVKSLKVSVGDKVKTGQILATLDQGQVLATLTQARGALLSARAKYNKILEGASTEEIDLARVALKNAETDLVNTKANQAILVSNAYRNLLNSSVAAFSLSSSSDQVAPTISGTYVLGKEGDIKITVLQGGNNGYFNVSGLVTASGVTSTTTPQPIGDSGLYILFPTNFTYQTDWIISIPNKKAANYLSNYNAYKNALETEIGVVSSAQALVDQKKAELNLKLAAARSVDLDMGQAEVLSAEGSLQSAQALFEDTIIRAPSSGTITKVDIKYGELASASAPVITIEDVDNLYLEANVGEGSVTTIALGQSVDVSYDALPNQSFSASISSIDPSATVDGTVINYKIKALISDIANIRPGMTANMSIVTAEIPDVLVLPKRSVSDSPEGQFVNLIIREKRGKYKTQKTIVTTGTRGDGDIIEIKSGLKEGDKVLWIPETK